MSTTVLNATTLPAILAANGQKPLDRSALPERVVQFGEGNFLRAFVDWMFDELNERGLFNGSIALVQPIERGLADMINDQDGLYTLLMRGLAGGQKVEQTRVIQSVSRCLNPYTQWDDLMALAGQDALRFAVSNTTEAGIAYVDEPQPDGACPQSFPAKLTAFLFARFTAFNGAADKGLVLIPCELIDRNGDKLRECIRQHIAAWHLGDAFAAWFEDACPVCNTLVDRIVPGYPRDEIDSLTARLGYTDKLIDSGEPFHLWVIEGAAELAKELPFTEAGLDVVWTDDMEPYRTRKVRMLNGPHTMLVAAAYLCGLETVREAVEHEVVGTYLRRGLFDEIVPLLNFPDAEKQAFAEAIIERFGNPFIKHYLLSITLNATSKYRVRVLPSLKESVAATGTVPAVLSFGLAANIAFTKATELQGDRLIGSRGATPYDILDDAVCLQAYATAWSHVTAGGSLTGLVKEILGNDTLWLEDLTQVTGLVDAVTTHLTAILDQGCLAAMTDLVAAEPTI